MPPTNQREAIAARWAKPENVEKRVDALAAHVRKIVDSLPPLTPEQKARLAAILAPSTGDGQDAS